MNILLHANQVDFITDSYSGEILAVFTALLSVMWWVVRNWITSITDKLNKIIEKLDHLEDDIAELDKRVTVNEEKDKETKKNIDKLIQARIEDLKDQTKKGK